MITKDEAKQAVRKAVDQWLSGEPAQFSDRQMAIHCVWLEAQAQIDKLKDADPIKEVEVQTKEVEVPAPFKPYSIDEVEQLHIMQTLEYTKWNKSLASNILGIERSTLDRKLRKYEVTRPGGPMVKRITPDTTAAEATKATA